MRFETSLILLAGLVQLSVHVVTAHTEIEGKIPEKEAEPRESCQDIREEAYIIRNEGYTAVSKAGEIREKAYRTKDEAFELKEEALEIKESTLEGRLALQTTLMETIALLKSQATATNLYIQEIRSTLSSIAARVDSLESKAEERSTNLDEKLEELQDKVSESAVLSSKVSERQKVWMSEVRLISHFKLTEQNNKHVNGWDSDIVVDGQFLFATTEHSNMRPYYHSKSSGPGNELVIQLGGLFRVHKIKLWNTRDSCCMSKLIGVHVYADDRLIGSVVETKYTYDFPVSEVDPVYAETVTIRQPLTQNTHLLEVQVWGNGPFDRGDIFA